MEDKIIYGIFLGIYILIIIGIGLYYSRKIKSMEDYLVAGRSVGFWKIVGTIIGNVCGVTAFIGFVGLGFTTGIGGIFYWVLPFLLFSLILAGFFGSKLRKLKIYTIADAFALRFGKNAALLPSLIIIFIYVIPTLAIQFIGMGTIFNTFFGLNLGLGIIISLLVVLSYVSFGGLPADIITDFLQSILLAIGLLLLLILGLNYSGGINAVLEITPQSYWNPIGNLELIDFLIIAFTVGPFYLVWQSTWLRIFASKNEKVAKKGVMYGFIISGILLSFSFLIGIIARGYLPHDLSPDMVFTQAIFTAFNPFIGSILIIGLASAIISGADSFVMSGASSITRDIYQQYLKPDANKKQMLRVSRMSVILISFLGLFVALNGGGIIPLYMLAVKTVGAGLVFPFLALMFWKRATQKGIIASMITGVGASIFLHFAGNPYSAIIGYTLSFLSVVIVSLLTSHATDEQVKSVYFDQLEIKEYHYRFRKSE